MKAHDDWQLEFAVIDCAARVFGDLITSRKPTWSSGSRTSLREAPVRVLRHWWSTSDPAERAMMAGRVKVWASDGNYPGIGDLIQRIANREAARRTGVPS